MTTLAREILAQIKKGIWLSLSEIQTLRTDLTTEEISWLASNEEAQEIFAEMKAFLIDGTSKYSME